jgi:hypothetical protein
MKNSNFDIVSNQILYRSTSDKKKLLTSNLRIKNHWPSWIDLFEYDYYKDAYDIAIL